MIRLLFTRSRQPAGMLIRAFEGGECDHVGVQLGPDLVIDAALLQGGVATHPMAEFMRGRQLVHAIDVDVLDEAATRRFLADQLGKPYDVTGILGFLGWRDWSSPRSWYCSELAAAALLHGGWTLADRHTRIGVRLLREIVHARACT